MMIPISFILFICASLFVVCVKSRSFSAGNIVSDIYGSGTISDSADNQYIIGKNISVVKGKHF